jgi:hypothetical protein
MPLPSLNGSDFLLRRGLSPPENENMPGILQRFPGPPSWEFQTLIQWCDSIVMQYAKIAVSNEKCGLLLAYVVTYYCITRLLRAGLCREGILVYK